MGRTEQTYGLPRLTFEEAGRVLGLQPGELMIWAMETLRPSKGRWSKWTNDKEPLPEAVIRLYLERGGGLGAQPLPAGGSSAAAGPVRPGPSQTAGGQRAKKRARG